MARGSFLQEVILYQYNDHILVHFLYRVLNVVDHLVGAVLHVVHHVVNAVFCVIHHFVFVPPDSYRVFGYVSFFEFFIFFPAVALQRYFYYRSI